MTDNSKVEILVVEDESDLAKVYTDILSRQFSVHTATGGEEALDIIDESIDIVLLDRRMPEMSGDEVLSAIRSRGLNCQVAMLTAVEPEQEIIDMPFDDYRLKPVSQSELVGLVETLRKRATYDALSQEYFSLVSKKAALELADNDEGEEYEMLLDQLDDLRTEMDTVLDRISAKAAFQEIADSYA